jgi:ATP-dependent Clp protease adaptor protein ClpS
MSDTNLAARKKTKQKLTEPSKWKVVMLNDDYTTMEFVVFALTTIFKHDEEAAHKLMVMIHTEGSAVAGVYSFEIAESKCVETTTLARGQGYPLQLKISQE